MGRQVRIEKRAQEDPTSKSYSKTENLKNKKSEIAHDLTKAIFPEGTVQDFLGIETIEYGLIKTAKNWVKIMEINPKGFSRMKAADKDDIIRKYISVLKGMPNDFQIKIITEKTDVTSLVRPYEKKLEKETIPILKRAREDNLRLIHEMSRGEALTKRYFLICKYEGNPYTGEISSDMHTIIKDMQAMVNDIDINMRTMGNNVIAHKNETNFAIETLYRILNRKSAEHETTEQRFIRIENDLYDIQYLSGDDDRKIDVPASSIIAPRGITPGYDYIIVDGIYYSYLTIKEESYPTRVYPAWVNTFAAPNCDVDIYYSKEDSSQLSESLERSISQHSVMMKYQNSRSSKEDMSDAIGAADALLARLRAKDDFYYCTIILTVKGESYAELKQNRGIVTRELQKHSIYVETALAENEKFFRMTLPLCKIDKGIMAHYRHNMTTESVASCYPFDEQRLRDEDGLIIGTSTYGRSLAAFNNFDNNRYNNANIGIFGPSGSGKTYFSLLLARRLRLADIGVFFVLPMKGYEYKYAVETLGGQFIDFSGGTNTCVNLFDITAEEDLDAQTMADLEITARSRLQQKVIEINTFFELLLNEPNGIDRESAANLDTSIVQLYKQYGITSDNASLYDARGRKKICPTIGDYYNYIKDNPEMKRFASVLRPFVEGQFSNFNGQTNVDMTNKMIAFDVSNNSESYQPVLIFLALNCCYSKMRENRKDKYALFIDEGWKMMINHNSAKFIDELVRIVRGYAGSAIFATQNLKDVYNRDCGESIISNMTSKFVLKIGDGEEEITKKVFRLTDAQYQEISEQKRGQVSLLVNKEIYSIITATSEIEDATYTTDPNKVRAAKKKVEAFLKDA